MAQSRRNTYYYILGKLPIILSVLVAPLTLWLVLQYNDSFKSYLFPSPVPEPIYEEIVEDEVDTGPSLDDPSLTMGYHKKKEKPAILVKDKQGDYIIDEEPPLQPPLDMDWTVASEKCKTAEDFYNLAKSAEFVNEHETAVKLFNLTLDRDPNFKKARMKLSHAVFDADYHLDDFSRFGGRQLEAHLKPFRKHNGAWVSPEKLKEVQEEWKPVSELLAIEIEKRKNDPYDDARRRHLRRLMRKDSFAKLIREGDYWTERPMSNCTIFIQGNKEEREKEVKGYLDLLTKDINILLETFNLYYIDPSQRGENKNAMVFIWIFESKKAYELFVDRSEKMIVINTPPDTGVYKKSETERRIFAAAFSRMLMKAFCKGDEEKAPRTWIMEGVPVLLSMGKGFDNKGRLKVNGDGMPSSERFKLWLGLNDGSWPVPIELLIDSKNLNELWFACSSKVNVKNPYILNTPAETIMDGALIACGLICRYIMEEGAPKHYMAYIRKAISGEDSTDDLSDLLGGVNLTYLEGAIDKLYLPVK